MERFNTHRTGNDGDGDDAETLAEAATQYGVIRQEGAVNLWDRFAIARRAREHDMDELADIAGDENDDRYLTLIQYYLDKYVNPKWTVSEPD